LLIANVRLLIGKNAGLGPVHLTNQQSEISNYQSP
jgi:hypothetical protein